MRVPASTYRLQITEDFDLLAAARILGYLHELGVDWVYLSPVLAAGSGSDHGYDVADHSSIDPSRGRAAGLTALSTEARRLGMGVLVDIVPNHVGIARPYENEWWWHVLRHGQDSKYAGAFDIDWAAGQGRLLIPVVGDDDLEPDGRIGNLQVLAGELHYHDQRFPLAPGTAEQGPGEDPNAVHARQHYRLISWREADRVLNYRRFFTVNTLAAIRVEDPEWFAASHQEIGRWFTEGLVDGLRVDHPDGLRDPGRYLEDLAGLTGGSYVLIEKILEPGETLPRHWATAGTTGYDALAMIDRVLTDPAGETGLNELEDRLRGGPTDWPELIHGTKRGVADTALSSEVRRIARELLAELSLVDEVAEELDGTAPTGGRDATPIVDAVAELLACFPVYRSYLPLGRDHLEHAFAAARAHRPDLGTTFDLIEPLLADGAAAAAQRFQQTSGMVMAKGVEDCAFYRWSRLTSLNEVGADPGMFAVSEADFHAFWTERHESWPIAMNTSSTHDTKRSEDARARIAVLAELPDEWAATLDRLLDLVPLPDPGFGNLLWQAIVGIWPADRDRVHQYADKAMREAGDRTTWTAPDAAYEDAVHAAVDAAFDHPEVAGCLHELVDRVRVPGWSNALAAKLLTLTVPGVPDVYQGTELFDLSLVDPDNRRPVDFTVRATALAELDAGAVLPPVDEEGLAKLALTHRVLTLRRDRQELFNSYTPLAASGPAADHLLGYDRGGVISLVTRFPVGLAARGGWADTSLQLPPGRWRNVLAEGTAPVFDADLGPVPVTTLLGPAPVAVLLRLTEPPRSHRMFDVWAPLPTTVELSVADQVIAMDRGADGWWTPQQPPPEGEVDYGYLLDGDPRPVPDPRSRWQPEGVHGRSRTFDPLQFAWTDDTWTGRRLAGSMVYELHVGTFTDEGTFDAAIGKLDHLRSIGVDFVEVMPINAFNGDHNWGYDGVLWSAVHHGYGGPAAYQRFVDACHGVGIGVIQDVVHNHLGPSGNYLTRFGPYLRADKSNPWGDVVNLDGPDAAEVRRLILDNVTMWFTEFHVDGIRLDAVHALLDSSEMHLLEEIAIATASLSAHLRRTLIVIAESDLNDTHLVKPREAGGYGLDAQWNDDFHHALHVALTRETHGYYADFEPLAALAKVLERGFLHDGNYSSFRGRDHGVPIDRDHLPGWRLVVFNSNHDQIGNRASGDRPAESLDDDQLACSALLTLTSPYTPMLFMGEEWAASTPFCYFTSHAESDLGQAVELGRLREFERMGWDAATVASPQDPETFQRSKLDWSESEHGRHAVILQVYRDLARIRRTVPDLTTPDLRKSSVSFDEQARWLVLRRGSAVVAVNFGANPVSVDLGHTPYELTWTTPTAARLTGERLELPGHAGALLLPASR